MAKWQRNSLPQNHWRHCGRLIWSGGTYVRPRESAAENTRLAWYQNQCNANVEKKRRRAVA